MNLKSTYNQHPSQQNLLELLDKIVTKLDRLETQLHQLSVDQNSRGVVNGRSELYTANRAVTRPLLERKEHIPSLDGGKYSTDRAIHTLIQSKHTYNTFSGNEVSDLIPGRIVLEKVLDHIAECEKIDDESEHARGWKDAVATIKYVVQNMRLEDA